MSLLDTGFLQLQSHEKKWIDHQKRSNEKCNMRWMKSLTKKLAKIGKDEVGVVSMGISLHFEKGSTI